MRIKTSKQMRLDELIKYVWENDHKNREYYSENRVPVDFTNNGHFSTEFLIDKDEVFTVEVTEELTEDTVFDELVFVYDDYAHRTLSGSMVRKSIQNILGYKSPIYKIYALVDRSLVLIWSADHGIPTDGTLEI